MPKANAQPAYGGPYAFLEGLQGTEGRLLAATFDCIAEKGAAATTTRDVTDRAGLNRGILHYHFKSKEDLLLRLLQAMFDNFTGNIDRIAVLEMPLPEKLNLICDSGLSLLERRRHEFLVTINLWCHAMAAGGEAEDVFRRLFAHFREAIARIVQEGERLGVFKPGSGRSIPLMLVGVVEGVALQYVMDPTAGDLEAVAEDIKGLFLSIRV